MRFIKSIYDFGYVVLGLLPSAGGKTCSLMHPCAHGQESRLLKPSLLVQNLRSHGFDVPFRRLLCKDKGVCCKKYEWNLANASYLLFHTAPSAIVETLAAVSALKKAFLLEMQEHVEPVVAGLLLIVEHFCHLVKSAGLVHGECEALLPVEVVAWGVLQFVLLAWEQESFEGWPAAESFEAVQDPIEGWLAAVSQEAVQLSAPLLLLGVTLQ